MWPLCHSQNSLRRKTIAKPGFVLITGELFIPASSEAASICCTKSRKSNKERNDPRQRVKDSVPESLRRPREKQNFSLGHCMVLSLFALLKLGPSTCRITLQLGGIRRRLSLSYDGNGRRQKQLARRHHSEVGHIDQNVADSDQGDPDENGQWQVP